MSQSPIVQRYEDVDKYLSVSTLRDTQPYSDQKPGTSGLRKRTAVFQQNKYYLENFVQSIFGSLNPEELRGSTLVVSGDGRYFSKDAIHVITQIAAANGVGRLWIGKHGLMSTPAVSAVIRRREHGVALGGIILTASHNPGGPEGDFGVKYNSSNGGPAPESLTEKIFQYSKDIKEIKICKELPAIPLDKVGRHIFQTSGNDQPSFEVEIVDSTQDYSELLKECFDLDVIAKHLLSHPSFSMVFDGMHGVAGPYAERVFCEELGLDRSCLRRCNPLEDFGGLHPDPNLFYAKDLVRMMGLTPEGHPAPDASDSAHTFGAASDGDADRNMILGKGFFVTPSDSLAIIAAHADSIKCFRERGGLRGLARSMPTSSAVDIVADKKGIQRFEVPTGWKFFGNLMDSKAVFGKQDYTPFLCGEESFGTGSDHIREKDGMWAVLAWMSILAHANKQDSNSNNLVGVQDIVHAHWKRYGRHFYSRFDYEDVEKEKAEAVMDHLRNTIQEFSSKKAVGSFELTSCDEFNYEDPVDGSKATKQGLRFYFSDGSRVVFRLSGTGSVGATIRMYLEKYVDESSSSLFEASSRVLQPLVDAALELSNMEALTGRREPTVTT